MNPKLTTVVTLILVPIIVLVTGFKAWLTHESIQAIVLEGFDQKLILAAKSTAIRIDGDMHEAAQSFPFDADLSGGDFTHYFDPGSSFISEHREIMGKMINALGLKYLYTQVYLGGNSIYYLLDGTENEDWSPPGSFDTLPSDSVIGIRDVQTFGIPWVSDTLDWGEWGLIRAAYIPIVNSSGIPVAMVGADVDISIIRSKTRQALFTVLFIGGFTLLAALFAVANVANTLSKPIAQIRMAAINLAAGMPYNSIYDGKISEIRSLALSLAKLSEKMDYNEKEFIDYQSRLRVARSQTPNRNRVGLASSGAEKSFSETQYKSPTLQRLFVLRHIPPFSGMTSVELLILAKNCSIKSYPANTIVCPSGYSLEHLLLPFRGQIVGPDKNPVVGFPGLDSVYSGMPLQESLLSGEQGCDLITLKRGKFLTLLSERFDISHFSTDINFPGCTHTEVRH